jgi:hypothetical protein
MNKNITMRSCPVGSQPTLKPRPVWIATPPTPPMGPLILLSWSGSELKNFASAAITGWDEISSGNYLCGGTHDPKDCSISGQKRKTG